MRTNTYERIGVLTIWTLLIVSLATVTAVGSVQATQGTTTQQPAATQTQAFECGEPIDDEQLTTRDELLSELRSLDGGPGAEAYSEFELVRSQAVLAIQAGEFTDEDQRRNAGVIRVLRSFERAYACLESSEYGAALKAANETAAAAEELSGRRGARYQSIVDIGLTRFYETAGGELLSVGEEQSATPDRIETFSKAATAFQRAGAADRFSQLSARLNEIEREFEADREQINESVAAAQTFADRCVECDDPVDAVSEHKLRVFTQYQAGVVAVTEIDKAQGLLAEHEIEDPGVSDAQTTVETQTTSLAVASGGIFVTWSLLVGLVAGVVGSRLVTWRRDLEAAAVGDVVLIGGILDD